ncbi:MAG: hypothetical protein JW729_07860, partial [Bacteroidales bacterium]|nr:hypothetical protein [Bacteroidales bacterium]
IGHGIRSIEDPELLSYLRRHKTPLEVSPTSNYALGIIQKNELHPIRKLLQNGIICTINSDDPAMFNTSLTQEYILLLQQGFTCDELFLMNKQALEVSFASRETKLKIQKQLEVYEKERILFEAINE